MFYDEIYINYFLNNLQALGERHNMDITIEGFHSWMWRGLSFLLPFLFIGYVFQFYNAYVLYHLSYHPEATWQVNKMTANIIGFPLYQIMICNFIKGSGIKLFILRALYR